MGIDFDALKHVASGENVDQAAEFAKSRFGDHADKIDEVAKRAKVFLAGESCGEQPDGHRDETECDGSVTHVAPVRNFFSGDGSGYRD